MSTPPSPSVTPPNDSTASPSREAPPNDSTATPSGEPPDSTASPSGEAPPNDSTASPSGEPPPNDSTASPPPPIDPTASSSWEVPIRLHHLLRLMGSSLFWLFILACVFVIMLGITLDDIINKSPRFYLSDLRGPPLEANPGSAVTVCEFTISNRARLLSVKYKTFEITLRHPLGREVAGTIPAFTQGRHKTRQEVSFQFENDTPVAAPRNLSGAAVFRISLQTRYRFVRSDGSGYMGSRTRVRLVSDVEVNREGRMTSPERILLKSAGAPGVASTGWLAVVVVVCSLIFIV